MEVDRRFDAESRSQLRSRRRHRRHGRRWRHRGRDSLRRRVVGGDDRGGTARHLVRFPHARSRRVSAALPGIGQPQDEGQGDQHPAGPVRGRRHDGQLDVELSHAGGDAELLAQRIRPRRVRGRRSCALVRTHGAARQRRALDRRSEREQRCAAARRAGAGLRLRHDPPQRQGLLEHRLLRHGLSHECETVDAGHNDPRSARARRDAVDACAGVEARALQAARSARRRCSCGAEFPIRTASSANARFSIRRSYPRR